MTENLSAIYLEQLKNTDKPAVVLAKFVSELLSITLTTVDIVKMSKLVKLYGRNAVFSGILDLADVDDVNSNYYGLLVYFLKKRLEKQTEDYLLSDLSEYINGVEKKLKPKKFRVPGPSEIKDEWVI